MCATLASIRRRFLAGEHAATATEYAVMLALVLVVIIASVTIYGQSLNTKFNDIQTTLFS
ncbi:MAG: Flp family type IVb pilin [Phycisphaerae bacterium]|jgi:Flp pilus assembly pilin Flp